MTVRPTDGYIGERTEAIRDKIGIKRVYNDAQARAL